MRAFICPCPVPLPVRPSPSSFLPSPGRFIGRPKFAGPRTASKQQTVTNRAPFPVIRVKRVGSVKRRGPKYGTRKHPSIFRIKRNRRDAVGNLVIGRATFADGASAKSRVVVVPTTNVIWSVAIARTVYTAGWPRTAIDRNRIRNNSGRARSFRRQLSDA